MWLAYRMQILQCRLKNRHLFLKIGSSFFSSASKPSRNLLDDDEFARRDQRVLILGALET